MLGKRHCRSATALGWLSPSVMPISKIANCKFRVRRGSLRQCSLRQCWRIPSKQPIMSVAYSYGWDNYISKRPYSLKVRGNQSVLNRSSVSINECRSTRLNWNISGLTRDLTYGSINNKNGSRDKRSTCSLKCKWFKEMYVAIDPTCINVGGLERT